MNDFVHRMKYLQVITVLNHAGFCTSYTTAWKYLKHLTQESKYLEIIREGYCLRKFDTREKVVANSASFRDFTASSLADDKFVTDVSRL